MPSNDAPAASRGYAKGRARRQEILQTAFRAFAEQGFRATSMREIADMVGLSQAGLLHHFASKEELLAEVLRLRDAEQEIFNERIMRESGPDTLRYLVELADLNARQAGLVRLYTVLAGEAVGPGHPAQGYFVQRYANVRTRVTSRLRESQAQGRIRDDADLAEVAATIIAAMDGLQIQWLLDSRAVDLKTAFATFLRVYLKGLAPDDRR
jgi:AcrR family transcriptional regulator